MDYWHNILTEKSWEILQKIKSDFNFTLIGGWAVYLWAKTHKSKDIDIIIDFETLSKLKEKYGIRKNEHLKKYEIKQEEIDIDIYVPYYSKLIIPLEEIETEKIEAFTVAKLEYLLVLKQGAEMERKESEKGEKDRVDILSILFNCSINYRLYQRILKKHNLEHLLERLVKIVKGFDNYKYLNLTPRELKLKKHKVLEELKSI